MENRGLFNALLVADLGFTAGKSKSLYSREGHQGITLVKHTEDQAGLKEAIRLNNYFEKDNRGRRRWTVVSMSTPNMYDDIDNDKNPNLVTVDRRSGEKDRILYGYLGTVFDLDKVDPETRKKVVIQSVRDRMTAT
jgi:hypothetical protein